MKIKVALLAILLTVAFARSQPSSILEDKGKTVRLVLLDAISKEPIPHRRVEFICEKEPCSPVSITTASDGSVIVSPEAFNEFTLIQVFSYFPRELRAAEWKGTRQQSGKDADERAWTLELSPRPSMVCSDKESPWTVSVYSRFAEITNNGKRVQFGTLNCTNAEASVRCGSGTRQDGFIVRSSRAGVSLASKSRAGQQQIAQLKCSYLP